MSYILGYINAILPILHGIIALGLAIFAIISAWKKPFCKCKSFLIRSSVIWTIYTIPVYTIYLYAYYCLSQPLNNVTSLVGNGTNPLHAAILNALFFSLFYTLPYLLLALILGYGKYSRLIRKEKSKTGRKKIVRIRRIAAAVLLSLLLINSLWTATLQGSWGKVADSVKNDRGKEDTLNRIWDTAKGDGRSSERITVRGACIDFRGGSIDFPFRFLSESAQEPGVYVRPLSCFTIYWPSLNGKTFRAESQTTIYYDFGQIINESHTYTLVERDTTGWLLIPSLWLALAEIGIWVAAEVIHRKRKTGVSTDE